MSKKSKKVVSYKNLPAKIPLVLIMSSIVCMDYYHAPEWLWGVVIFLLSLLTIFSIVSIVNQESKDIF